jgi:hypothetical protein
LTSVAGFDVALVTHDWAAVYYDSTESTQGQYSEAAFVAAIDSQLDSAGTVTKITPVVGKPTIQVGTVGEPFFAAKQTETIERHGKSFTLPVTSYFLLEQGSWRFWFSQ